MWCILDKYTDQRTWYKVQCRCGYVGRRRADHVTSGRTTCCKKCASKQTAAKHGMPYCYKGVGELSATFWLHIRNGAKKRGTGFAITIDYVWNLFLQQQGRCALSGQPITMCRVSKDSSVWWAKVTASLDRIDSDKGYIVGNVQWVHKVVNYIKRDLDEAEFIKLCGLIHAHQQPVDAQ